MDKKNEKIKELAPKKTPTPENKMKKVKKEKLQSIALPDKNKEKVQLEEEKKQKPSKKIKKDKELKTITVPKKPKIEDAKVKQVSEFEKKELFDPNNIAALIDNCTDGMFLCLKYLNYTGTVSIPSKTYCSVPCTIINAG